MEARSLLAALAALAVLERAGLAPNMPAGIVNLRAIMPLGQAAAVIMVAVLAAVIMVLVEAVVHFWMGL